MAEQRHGQEARRHGEVGGLGQKHMWRIGLYGGPLDVTDKERIESLEPACFLLTGRSGGNDRTLPPRV